MGAALRSLRSMRLNIPELAAGKEKAARMRGL